MNSTEIQAGLDKAVPERTENNLILEVEDLEKEFFLGKRKISVLRGLGMMVREGESVAVVGASGAGKTTLLHILGGLDKPSEGKVYFKGNDLYRLSAMKRTQERARRIGFIFQFYHLLPELDILENVMLPSMNFNLGFLTWIRSIADSYRGLISSSAVRKRAMELLCAVGLKERVDHLPLELSGGEQQRAAVARALMNEPELVLADEPTGNLDSVAGNHVLDILFSLVKKKKSTLILVTHNAGIAGRCDRILELKDGCLVF